MVRTRINLNILTLIIFEFILTQGVQLKKIKPLERRSTAGGTSMEEAMKAVLDNRREKINPETDFPSEQGSPNDW